MKLFRPPPLALALARVEEKTASSRKTVIFDVSCAGEHFATVTLASGPFKLGDVVQGFVEFPDAEPGKPVCIQVGADLSRTPADAGLPGDGRGVPVHGHCQAQRDQAQLLAEDDGVHEGLPLQGARPADFRAHLHRAGR